MEKTNLLLIILPIATAILGWIAARLLGPTFDNFGIAIREKFKSRKNTEYDVYEAYSMLEKRITELHAGRHNRFNESKPYLYNHAINKEVKSFSQKKLNLILKTWIDHARIGSYANSDVFFAGMELLLKYFKDEDIKTLFNKHKDNNQANLWVFFELVETQRPEILSSEILSWLRIKQNDWNKKIIK